MEKQDERTMDLSEIVPEYDSAFFLVKNLFWDRIHRAVQLAEVADGSRVLDVGCGIGYLCREVRKKNSACALTGIDINVNVEKLAVPNCRFMVADITRLSLPDNSFDIVFALDSLEHIADIAGAMTVIKRILKPQGTFVVSGPTESAFYKMLPFSDQRHLFGKKRPGHRCAPSYGAAGFRGDRTAGPCPGKAHQPSRCARLCPGESGALPERQAGVR
jgi:ubiquinone/menaquinone biosynthesis C-methylase UbiE